MNRYNFYSINIPVNAVMIASIVLAYHIGKKVGEEKAV